MSEEVKTDEIEKPTAKPIVAPVGKGIKLPPLQATGDLTVESKEEEKTQPVVVVGEAGKGASAIAETLAESGHDVVISSEPPVAEPEKKEPELPQMGTKFMINGQEYKVCYINHGKKRFSAEPCKGLY